MALTQTFTSSENSAGTSIFINDTTGEYTVNNDGGYGSPNSERSEVALIAFLVHKLDAGDSVLTAEAYDPETIDQWEWSGINAQSNGWYQGTIYTFNIKTGSETPSEGDYVYNATSDELERYNGSAWVAIPLDNWYTQITADSETPTKTLNHMHLSGYYLAFNYMVRLIVTGCNCKSKNELRTYKEEVKEQLDGFRIHFCGGNESQAQLDAERYNDRISQLLALE